MCHQHQALSARLCTAIALLLCCAGAVWAQTTAFTYQGKLTDAGNPTNGNYDLQFKLFDSVTVGTGTQQGATLARNPVAASAGIFTVTLDFGANVFSGADRYLEIGVRPAGNVSAYTLLAPRHPVTSTPYAIQTLNAQQLGGLPASDYVTTATVGNAFVKNDTAQQTGANFNIDGNGIIGNSLGIGTTPLAGIKLDVLGAALISPGNGGAMEFGTPNAETGMSNIVGSGRADLRFDGTTVKLVAGPVGVPPPSTNGVVIDTAGRVGIGTTNLDNGKLSVSSDARHAIFGTSITFAGVYGKSVNGFGVYSDGYLGVNRLGTGGNIALCKNIDDQIATCSSSLRYKKDFQPFGDGMSFVDQLRPIAFKWKADNTPDIGLGAEDVAKINPLFALYSEKGEVEGVKYDRLSVVFVNAFKEQQAQIEQQQKRLEQQGLQIENLKNLICLDHPNAGACRD